MGHKSTIGYSYMLKIIIFTILGLSGVHSCDDTAVLSCVTDIGQALGIPENQVNGLTLFSTLNPQSDDQQQRICNVLQDFDLTSLPGCISLAGCTDTSIIPSGIKRSGEMDVPTLTWKTVVVFIQGLCEPGCAHFASKNVELQQCSKMIVDMNGNLSCGGLKQVLKCYKETIGSCEPMEAIIESSLASSGLMDFADNCGDESVDGETVDNNTNEEIGELEDTTNVETLETVTKPSNGLNCNGLPSEAHCCHEAMPTCFDQFSHLLPLSEGQVNGTAMFDLILDLQTDNQQDTICSAIEGFDYSILVECITTSGCANITIFSDDLSDLPHMSWMSLVKLFENLCGQDCADFSNKTGSLDKCGNEMMQHGDGDLCKSLDWGFNCMRQVIGGCSILSTVSEHIWTENGMMGHINYACPEVNTDLHSDILGHDKEVISEVCNSGAVQACYTDLASQLGYDDNEGYSISGMQLYALIMPENSVLQDYTCGLLQGFDYSALKTCIASSGCSNTSILPPELDGQFGFPQVTWLSIVSLIESFCGPDCANASGKHQAAKECGNTFHGGTPLEDACLQVQQVLCCYKNAMGSCDVLLLFTEEILLNSDHADIINYMAVCNEDEIFDLSPGIEDACEQIETYDDFEDECDESDYNKTTVRPEVTPYCEETVAQECFAEITQQIGITNDKISILHLSNLANPGNEPMQEHVCSSLENFDFTSLKSCVAASFCPDSYIYENIDDFTVTWMSAVEQVETACHPVTCEGAAEEAAVGRCFAALAQDLGLPSSYVSGVQLFSLLNPMANEQQEQTCNALRNHDLSPVKSCIAATGCAESNIVPPGMGFPAITWLTLVDWLKDFCEPGCGNLASIREQSQECGNTMGGGNSNICSGMEDTFQCYRDVIGSCQILVSITESTLKSSGILDMAKEICPDVNTGLGVSKKTERERIGKNSKKETKVFNIPARLRKESKLRNLLEIRKSIH